jgi:hypothetical protein
MEMPQTHCYATGIVTLLWKCYKLIVMQQAVMSLWKRLICHIMFAVTIAQAMTKYRYAHGQQVM